MFAHRYSKTFAKGVVVAALAALGSVASAQTKEFRILESGGTSGDSIEEAYIKPYTARTGVKVVRESPTSLGKLQAMVQSKSVTTVLVELGATNLFQARALGLLEPLDWSKINPEPMFAEAKQPDGFGYQYFSTIIAWPKGAKPMTSWADFWNVKDFPGKRALPDYPSYTLPLALLADGVKPENLYRRRPSCPRPPARRFSAPAQDGRSPASRPAAAVLRPGSRVLRQGSARPMPADGRQHSRLPCRAGRGAR